MARRRPITLIELLLATTLLALALGWIGVQIPRVFHKEHFQSSAERVLSALITTQEIMLDTGGPATCRLTSEQVCVETPFSNRTLDQSKRPHALKGITAFAWNGEQSDTLSLTFSPTACPSGTLTLIGKGEELTFNLPGFPGRIARGTDVYTPKAPPRPSFPAA